MSRLATVECPIAQTDQDAVAAFADRGLRFARCFGLTVHPQCCKVSSWIAVGARPAAIRRDASRSRLPGDADERECGNVTREGDEVVDQQQNFQKAIRARKARNVFIDSILTRPVAPGARVSRGYHQNLSKEKVHNEEIIADLEAQDARLRLRTEFRESQRVSSQRTVSRQNHLPNGDKGEFAAPSRGQENTVPECSDDRSPERIQLGQWAARCVEELKKVNRIVLGKDLTEQAVRNMFPDLRLWRDVVDRLYPKLKEHFFDDIALRRWKQPELFDLLGNTRGVSGATLYGHYKTYRKASGLGRKHDPPKRKISNTKTV
jgi:hypothetical protein